jgi:secreted Zn-dependent insulinase-like peptidase
LWSPKQEWIDEVIEQLKTRCQLDLEKEEYVASFLGVHIERNKHNNTIKLTQSGLAERICEALV